MRTLVLLAAVALFAGCLSPSPEVEAAEVEPAVANETLLPEPEETPLVLTTASFPFAYDGRTGTGACVPSGPGACTGTGVSPSESTFTPLVYEGAPSAAEATLTWSAPTPATSEMFLMFMALKPCGDGCWESSGESYRAIVSGTSPLTLSATDVVLGVDEVLLVHVGIPRRVPPLPNVAFSTSVEQAFHVEGNVQSLVRSDV